MFCPQCGQKVIGRPAGSDSSHAGQLSPGSGVIVPEPGAITPAEEERTPAGGDTLRPAVLVGVRSADSRAGEGMGAGGITGGAGGDAGAVDIGIVGDIADI